MADAYGAELVHYYRADGSYHQSLDDTDGGGRFSCPHGLAFDTRSGHDSLLHIADRGNLYMAEWRIGGRLIKIESLLAVSSGKQPVDWLHPPTFPIGMSAMTESCKF